jgi:PAS domain S-box-containing protein
VLLHKATFNNLDGTLAGIIGVEVDITERKRVEQEMKNLAKFPEENPNPVMRINRDGVLLYANHPSNALLKLWGCEVGHPLPEEWRRNVHESLISVTNRIIEVTTDGQFYLLNLAPIADMDYLNIYVVNITELKQAEERLRESERRFRETLTSLNLIALQLNSEGIIMFANNYLLKIAGCSRDDIIGKNWMDSFIPEEIRESVRQIHWQNCRVGAIRTDYINEICVKDGERLLISWNNSRLHDEKGGIIGITSIGLDITEKSRIEDALRQSEIRFRELVENMNSAVAVYRAVDDGDDFVFQEVNRALEGIEKVKEKDILGRRVTEAFPGVRTFGLLNVFQRVYRTGIPERFPATFYQDQRISGWRDNHIYKLPSGEIVAVYDDVTAQKRAEERILASLKEKEVLLKEIHHRVKNNLQIISALMALQTKHDKDKTPAEIFQDCRNRIRSMALIHESLYSTDNLADINFRRYLEKLTSRLLASNASGSQGIRTRVAGADVKLDISQAVPCGLIANELITNSLKHAFTGRPQGEIQVTFQSTAEQRVLEVRDDGLGLGTDFNPETSGTFGWMMVRNLVRQLKGEFSVESNGGTRCKIVF